jgi:uncharacterized protein (DUF427 family)
MRAIWNNEILAESDDTRVLEDLHYFPPSAINSQFFQLSEKHSQCPERGKASYFHIQVGDQRYPDAAFFYPHPNQGFAEIKDHVAFSDNVEIKK